LTAGPPTPWSFASTSSKIPPLLVAVALHITELGYVLH
jgi:hypothetical protein